MQRPSFQSGDLENIINRVEEEGKPQPKLYNETQLIVGTVLGGPLVAGFITYVNFRRLGETKKGEIAVLLAMVFIIALLWIMFFLPDYIAESFLGKILSYVNAGIAAVVFKFYMGERLKKFFKEENGRRESNWKVAGLVLLAVVITLLVAFQISAQQPLYPGDKMVIDGNEIYHDEDTSEEDMVIINDKMIAAGYFDPDGQSAIYVDTWLRRYEITMAIDKSFWQDELLIEELQVLKTNLEFDLGKEVILILEHYELSGDRKTKKI